MSKVRTVLGSFDIGQRASLEESKLMLDLFSNFGNEIDAGVTDVYLGNLKEFGIPNFSYATKAFPSDGRGLGTASVTRQLNTALNGLKSDKVDIFYLQAPDHNTPLKETLAAVDALHKEGKFVELGLSNYSAWLVAEVVNVCKQHGYVTPTVCEGMYSVLTRMVEKELIPCLRYFGIRFYGYSPLGGGFLSGKYKMEDKTAPGRFFGSSKWASMYRDRYWKQEYFKAIEEIHDSLTNVYGEGKVSVAEAAYRWIYNHSALKGEFGDGVIMGAHTVKQLEKNLSYTTKGPLNEKVVAVMDSVWSKTSHLCPDYAR